MKIIFNIFLIGFILTSCTKNDKKSLLKEPVKKQLDFQEPKILSDTLVNAMGAYFFNDGKDNILLNWTEEIDTSRVFILKYRNFDKRTKQFGETITVLPSKGMQSHHESMAKIAINKDGVMYAVFRVENKSSKRRFAGNIYYSISIDNGENWSEKIKLVTDKESKSQSFFDVIILPDGELGLSWLDSRKLEKDKDGSTLYFTKSKEDQGFVIEKPVAGSTCQCCRTDIFVDSAGKINIAFRNLSENSIRDMYRVVSADIGKTFSEPKKMGKDNWKIDGCPHTGPSLADNGMDISVVWFTGADSGTGIFFKNLYDEEPVYEIKKLISNVGSHPQMTALPNGNFFIVYEEFYKVKMTFLSNIVLQIVDAKGNEIKRKIISKPNSINDHAVITTIENNALTVAWVTKENKKTKIEYTIVNY